MHLHQFVILLTFLACSSFNAHAQIYSMTSSTRLIIDGAETVLQGAQSAGSIIALKAEYQASLNRIRDDYWKAHLNSSISQEQEELYQAALMEKDLYFLFGDHTKYAMSKRAGLTYWEAEKQESELFVDMADNPLMDLLGGKLDGGIHHKAKIYFARWKKHIYQEWFKSPGTNLDEATLIEIIKADTVHVVNYLRTRDLIEAYEKNNFSSDQFKEVYEYEFNVNQARDKKITSASLAALFEEAKNDNKKWWIKYRIGDPNPQFDDVGQLLPKKKFKDNTKYVKVNDYFEFPTEYVVQILQLGSMIGLPADASSTVRLQFEYRNPKTYNIDQLVVTKPVTEFMEPLQFFLSQMVTGDKLYIYFPKEAVIGEWEKENIPHNLTGMSMNLTLLGIE